jgi:hypothetical protein
MRLDGDEDRQFLDAAAMPGGADAFAAGRDWAPGPIVAIVLRFG